MLEGMRQGHLERPPARTVGKPRSRREPPKGAGDRRLRCSHVRGGLKHPVSSSGMEMCNTAK